MFGLWGGCELKYYVEVVLEAKVKDEDSAEGDLKRMILSAEEILIFDIVEAR